MTEQSVIERPQGGAPPHEPSVIETRGLTKTYGRGRPAVDTLDLSVPRGSVYGFLGPNGSGKTTTIRMLLGLVAPTAGRARLLGAAMPGAAREVLPRVGALIEGPGQYGFLSGRDNLLRLDAADPTADPATRRRRVEAALDRVGLAPVARRRTRTYSLGMRQRLGLAAALLRPRELLVLDEPTNGLDPQGMREIRGLVRELAADGTTVFLSSHLLDEVEQVCTHAAVMARGRLVAHGPVEALFAASGGRVSVSTPDTAEAARVLTAHGVTGLTVTAGRVLGTLPPAMTRPAVTSTAVTSTAAGGCATGATGPVGTHAVPVPVPVQGPGGPGGAAPAGGPAGSDVAELNAALVAAGVRVRAFGTERASLEEVFVELTGEGFDVAD
ncbi:ABC transporter ATP-binding protein [Streptomyces sp. NPDC059740]|uniref:ABC transporter ATP-binding protein n=1 Tax=Streptomyces sp. NPDC059740 TaxID=3346926 RepID=UPI003651111E